MMRKVIILVFFSMQVFGIIISRFTDLRYFCWAPYDQISLYEIMVEVNGVILSQEEIKGRYNLQGNGRENRSIHNVFNIIRQYEESYGKLHQAVVKVRYCTNGKAKEEWNFNTE